MHAHCPCAAAATPPYIDVATATHASSAGHRDHRDWSHDLTLTLLHTDCVVTMCSFKRREEYIACCLDRAAACNAPLGGLHTDFNLGARATNALPTCSSCCALWAASCCGLPLLLWAATSSCCGLRPAVAADAHRHARLTAFVLVTHPRIHATRLNVDGRRSVQSSRCGRCWRWCRR